MAEAVCPTNSLKYSEYVVHLSRNGRHILLHRPSRQWVMLENQSYELVEQCLNMPLETATELASGLSGTSPKQVVQLFRLLLEKHILILGAEPNEPRTQEFHPRTANFSVTGRCNLRCTICFADATFEPDEAELSTDEIKAIAVKLSQGGCKLLRVTGGEPLLREDLVGMLRLARDLFEVVVLQTNGTLLNQRIADELVGIVDRVEIALDGSTPYIHEAIRGVGTFERTVAGIGYLQRAGIRTIINRVLTRFSIDDGPKMEDLARSLGAELRSDMYLAIGRGREARQHLAVPPEQLACVRGGEASRTSDEQDRASDLRGVSAARVRERCGAITEKISVSPHGKVYPCELLRGPEFAIGSIRDATSLSVLLRIRNPIVETILTRTIERVAECSTCDVRYFCDGLCMAEAHSYTGSIWGVDPNCPVKKAQLRTLLWGETGGWH